MDFSEERVGLFNRHQRTAVWKTNFSLRSIFYEEIRGGGPGKDDIPPIDNPTFESTEEAGLWLKDREPVQVANIKGVRERTLYR